MQIKVLMAKLGMDGHDAGVKVVATALRDAGMDVIYTGPYQTVQSVAETAIQEDVDVIGISSLASDHVLVPKLVELLRRRKADNIKVVVGGVVPDEDADELKQAGVAEVFPPGSTLDSMVNFIRKCVNVSIIGTRTTDKKVPENIKGAAGCEDGGPQRRSRAGERENLSGITLKSLYTPQDIQDLDPAGHLGTPGEYPFVRGVYPTMYRGQLWSKRMLIGFESPEIWNDRQKAMFGAGQTAVNLVFCNTWMRGYDVDQVEKKLVGTCGTPINALADMEICFDGIPVENVSVALNDCGPFTSTAMLVAMAQKRGVSPDCMRGTTNQADFISHYLSLHMYHRFSLEGHERMTIDHVKYVTQHMPLWNPLSLIGQHMQQAGATPVQEMAFTIASGIYYINQCVNKGMNVDGFARRFSFFFNVTISIFEEAAKFRAGRRVWAKLLKERFGAKDPRSMRMKFHAQTSGRELTRQQVQNNIARVAFQALAAILGGAQSLHTDAYDEALTSPSREAARVALMTQNIIAEETGVADVIDPLGGSYYLETLTNQVEEKIWDYIHKIDALGGMLEAVKKGFIQSEIERASLEFQRAVDNKERIVVGLNDYVIPEREDIRPPIARPDPQAVDRHIERIKKLKTDRHQARARAAMDGLKKAAEDEDANLFEAVIRAVQADVTHGEVVSSLREVYGADVPMATIG